MSKKRYWLSCDGDFYDEELDKCFSQQSLEDLLNRQDQEIQELKEKLDIEIGCNAHYRECVHENKELKKQLENAIVPKFKVGQDLYIINEFDYSIVPFEIDKILITENGVEIKSVEWEEWFTEDEFFITREEAQAKLEELGENNANNN